MKLLRVMGTIHMQTPSQALKPLLQINHTLTSQAEWTKLAHTCLTNTFSLHGSVDNPGHLAFSSHNSHPLVAKFGSHTLPILAAKNSKAGFHIQGSPQRVFLSVALQPCTHLPIGISWLPHPTFSPQWNDQVWAQCSIHLPNSPWLTLYIRKRATSIWWSVLIPCSMLLPNFGED